MPYKRKDSRYWWITYTDTCGRQASKSSKTTDFSEAKALEHKLRAETSRIVDPNADKTFDDVILVYLESKPNERARYAAMALFPSFSGRLMASITAHDIHIYRAGREVSDSTIRRELGVLSAAINWCRKHLDWDIKNPIEGRLPKKPPGRLRWATRGEIDALCRAVDPKADYLVDFIRLAVNAGFRRDEMLRLEWSRVDLQQGLVYLRPMNQKGKRHSSVPLNTDARAALMSRLRYKSEHCPGSPWVFCKQDGSRIASVKRSFTTAHNKAGMPEFHIHDLRHTCAAWLVQAGVPLRTVAEILRHADIATTMQYAHLAPENARAGVDALDSEPKTSVPIRSIKR